MKIMKNFNSFLLLCFVVQFLGTSVLASNSVAKLPGNQETGNLRNGNLQTGNLQTGNQQSANREARKYDNIPYYQTVGENSYYYPDENRDRDSQERGSVYYREEEQHGNGLLQSGEEEDGYEGNEPIDRAEYIEEGPIHEVIKIASAFGALLEIIPITYALLDEILYTFSIPNPIKPFVPTLYVVKRSLDTRRRQSHESLQDAFTMILDNSVIFNLAMLVTGLEGDDCQERVACETSKYIQRIPIINYSFEYFRTVGFLNGHKYSDAFLKGMDYQKCEKAYKACFRGSAGFLI